MNRSLRLPIALLTLAIPFALTCKAADTLPKESYGLYNFFHKLENKQQVTVAAIGGSITMTYNGWAKKTVDLIAEAYPEASVRYVNAGVSSTGSNLGVFRLQRDVIDYRPDLVFVEYAVNDGGTDDRTCIRNLESIVVRLRSLPNPPAIVFVQAAAGKGGNHSRHNLVAQHYGIMSVNMQMAVEENMAQTGSSWDALFGDNVHPRGAGHDLYAQTLFERLQPYRHSPDSVLPEYSLPKALSEDELILDGTLVVLNFSLDGWSYKNDSVDGWWRRFFQGSLQSSENAGALHLPFYGRTIGLWMLTKEGRGKVRVLIDGEYVKDISANLTNWYYSVFVPGKLLEEQWHVLSLIPIGVDEEPAIARIGYLLMEDQTKAPEPGLEFWASTWLESQDRAEKLTLVSWEAIPADAWTVLGPFGGESKKPWENPQKDMGADFGVELMGEPNLEESYTGYQDQAVRWQQATGKDGWVDIKGMYGLSDRSITYAHIQVEAPAKGSYEFRIAADYFVTITINGKRVFSKLEPHGSARGYMYISLPLEKGINDLWVTLHSGSMGYGFSLALPSEGPLMWLKPD